jgi:hypothetical protein
MLEIAERFLLPLEPKLWVVCERIGGELINVCSTNLQKHGISSNMSGTK